MIPLLKQLHIHKSITLCNYQVSIFDWPPSMLQCTLYLEEAPQKLPKCYNFKLYFVLFGLVFFCLFFSSLGLFVVGVFFLANLSPVCTVIALFPYLLFWNKEKQHMAPELRTRPSFNLQ